jgi:hypothetical protein
MSKSPKKKSPAKRKSPVKTTTKCPSGQILRKGYMRQGFFKESGTYVPASFVESACIEDIGKPGKGEKLFDLTEPIGFYKFGYHYADKSASKRQNSLAKAMKEVNSLSLLRYINALRTLNKNRAELFYNLDMDLKFIQQQYNKNK